MLQSYFNATRLSSDHLDIIVKYLLHNKTEILSHRSRISLLPRKFPNRRITIRMSHPSYPFPQQSIGHRQMVLNRTLTIFLIALHPIPICRTTVTTPKLFQPLPIQRYCCIFRHEKRSRCPAKARLPQMFHLIGKQRILRANTV
jgi:hypothetical protein